MFGFFWCICKIGYIGNGVDCVDINECECGEYNCYVNFICVNLNGLYSCICLLGFNGNGLDCDDINECI